MNIFHQLFQLLEISIFCYIFARHEKHFFGLKNKKIKYKCNTLIGNFFQMIFWQKKS